MDSTGPTRENLNYLKEQRICERLESMVRHVLISRPEDPVLAMCNYLNDSNRSGGSTRVSLTRAARPQGEVPAHVHSAGSRRLDSSTSSPTVAANNSTRAFPVAAAVVAPSDSRRGSFVANASSSRLGSAVAHPRLERDESSRSDVSAFSVTSIDMAEFLADFRSAHYSLFLNGRPYVSIDDLADIVDRIALPIPDTSLLGDLFNDMADEAGIVPFEAFLARMNYRISGKYHVEVVRRVFFALVKASLTDETEVAAFEKRLGSADDLAVLVEEDQAVRGHAMHSPAVPAKGAAGSPAAPVQSTVALQRTTITVHVPAVLEAVKHGIGLRINLREADELFNKMNIHVDGSAVTLHILDLSRFMSLATVAFSHAQPFVPPVSSVGVDLNELTD